MKSVRTLPSFVPQTDNSPASLTSVPTITLPTTPDQKSLVESFDQEKQTGFIHHIPRNGIFFHRKDVIPDVVGRQILKPQTIVSFELTESRRRFRASNVKDESPELAGIDLETYTETSYVHTLTQKPPNEMGESSFGFLVRPSEDQLL